MFRLHIGLIPQKNWFDSNYCQIKLFKSMFEYLIIFKFTILISILTFVLISITFLFNFFFSKNSIEKLSAYECGFESFSINPIIKNFEIEFLLIALLFLIFDLEIIFLIPWLVFYMFLGFYGFLIMSFFFFCLIFGFFIEYIRGILNWTIFLRKNEM